MSQFGHGQECSVGEAGDERMLWRILLDFGQTVLQEIEVNPLLQRTAAQVARGTGIKHVKIVRYRPDHADLLMEAGVGWMPGVVGKARFGSDVGSPPGRCMQTGLPVVIADLRGDPEYRQSKVLADHGLVAVANVPIIVDGRAWGVLEADSDQPGRFTEGDIEFLTAVSHLLAGALQRVDARARAEAAAAAIAGNAARHAMLLAEIQHRAKNNLQLVVAMLAQERRVLVAESPLAAERFGRVMERVTAVSIAHDNLSVRPGADEAAASSTDLAQYLRALCSALALSLGERLLFELDLDPCVLPFDRAVPLGLIVNELVTNAAKHAYPDEQASGVIRLQLCTDVRLSEATLTVTDDGAGMAGDVAAIGRANRPAGQGLVLVQLLAGQLGGAVEGGRADRGTSITVRFPLAV